MTRTERDRPLDVRHADLVADAGVVRALFGACARSVNERLADVGVDGRDVAAAVDAAMREIAALAPPHGRLLVARLAGEAVGCVALRRHTDDMAELSWLYVRPDRRRRGVGRELVARLLEEARHAGYARVRTDLARSMLEAQALARAAGFVEVEPFAGTSVPRRLQSSWAFLERPLRT